MTPAVKTMGGQDEDGDAGEWWVELDEGMGGELADAIRRISQEGGAGCFCEGPLDLSRPRGYGHPGGYADGSGERWWLFYRCGRCGYDWSAGKIIRREAMGG